MGTGKADTLRFYTVGISGTDSVFTPSSLATAVSFPLDFTNTSSGFYFDGIRGKDTLQLQYQVKAQFVSDDCGSRFFISNMELLKSTFDSIRVVDKSPSNRAGTNIEIYRCPRTDTMAIAFRQLVVSSTGARSSQALSLRMTNITPDFTNAPLYVDQQPSIIYLPVNIVDFEKQGMVVTFNTKDYGTKKVDLGYTLTDAVRYRPCGNQTFVSQMTINPVEDEMAFDSVGFVRDDNGRQIRSVSDPFTPMINIYRCPQTNLAGIYFLKESGAVDTARVTNIKVDGVNVTLQKNELQSINVPLNSAAPTTTITFEFQSGETKSVVLRHTNNNRVNFTACGTHTSFTGLTVQSSDFGTDGVSIRNASTQSIPTRNIEIIQ